ncbi:DUF3943 domain-containing protein [Sphingobacterium siyangense]|uniref:DUF3943 domain-containing protein n=1 Tax=Sphingobacterium siyangense TaxID=459529 RepID=UPI001965FEB7|nr:DUF3943 domain-containing protein [Sphingobacterium siyangense]QRY56555.1 DUF3943 domain-containing protein [Sphingobacterium siyangense]
MFISIKQRINQRHYSLFICIFLLLVQLGSIGPSKAAFLPARDSLMTSDSLFRANPVEKYPMYHDEQPRLWNNHLINVKQTDSLFDYQKKNFLRAGIEWFSIQAIPASVNYFIRKDPVSHISFKNFFSHLKLSAWTWDDNLFATNQMAHPYHGQFYFNSFRSNNYSFLQSTAATVAGSYIWETAGETEPPSINDIINTSFGGTILGEMTHRLSHHILSRPSLTKGQRNKKELLAMLINPINGLNRLLDGRWGDKVKGAVVDSSLVHTEVELGLRRFDAKEHDILNKGKNDIYARIKLIYTNDDLDKKKPFDDFFLNLELGSDDSSIVNAVNVYASLYGNRILSNLTGRHRGIVSAHFDFLRNEAFYYGSQSINYNVFSNFNIGSRTKLTTILGGGPVVLAAVPDPYLHFGESRTYDYGPGADVRASATLSTLNRFKFGIDYRGGYFVTISGNKSHHFLHAVSTSASMRIWKNFGVNLYSGYFRLEGHYQDHNNVNKDYPFVRIALAYNSEY